SLVDDPVNAASIERFIEAALFDLAAQKRREVHSVLKNAPIHIHDVERSIGSIIKIHGTKTFVGGGKELSLLVSIGCRNDCVPFEQNIATDQIGGWLGRERVTPKIKGKIVSTINHGAACGCELDELSVAQNVFFIAAINTWRNADGPD